MPPDHDLGLTGINVPAAQAAGQPTIYGDQFPLEPGFHLRWQLRQGLGLPERFFIYRTNRRFFDRIYTSDLDGGYNLTQEAVTMGEAGLLTLLETDIYGLTESAHETFFTAPAFVIDYGKWNALEWLTDDPGNRGMEPSPPSPYSDALKQIYTDSPTITGLRSLIRNLFTINQQVQEPGQHHLYAMHQQVIEQDESGKSFRTSLKRMDALNLAALDPHFARMAGFYFIDRQMPFQETGSSRIGYFVVADYTSQPYPFTIVVPKREVVLLEIASEMRFEGFKAVASGGSYLHFSAADAHNLGFLTTFSGFNPTIRLVFDEPNGIEEAIIIVETTGQVTLDFVAADGWYGHDGISIAPLQNGSWQISARQTTSGITLLFKNLYIKGTGSGSLIIKQVQFRSRVGFIGLLKSNPIILGGGVGEDRIQPLVSGRASSEPMAPVLNDQGHYDPFQSNLKLSLVHKTRPVEEAYPNIIASNSPVRAIFERTTPGSSPVRSEMTIIRGANRALPELVFYAPLASTPKDYATGQPILLFGNSRLVKDNPLDKTRQSLLITGNGGAYAAESGALWSGQAFTISLRLKIAVGNPANDPIPLVSFGGEQGVSLGFRHANGSLFWRLKIGAQTSESPPVTLYLNTWRGINLSFDNGRVIFNYADGARIAGPPVPLMEGGIAIGMDFNSETNQVIRSFKGQLCNVRIWNKVISTYDANYLLREYAADFSQRLLPTSFFSLKETLVFSRDYFSAPRTTIIPILNTLNAGFSCHFWLNIDNDGGILFSDTSQSFRFGATNRNVFPNGVLFFESGGFQCFSTHAPPVNTWVHIALSYAADVHIFRFYIDGNVDHEVPDAELSFSSIQQPIYFGSEPDGNWRLDGKIADIHFYPYAVAPAEVAQDFATYQLLETGIPDGMYDIRATGIDLFGRLSPPSHLMQHQSQSDYAPHPPAGLKAEILTFETTVQGAALKPAIPPEADNPIWEIRLQPSADLSDSMLNALARHAITLSKAKTTSLTNIRLNPQLVRQKYEVINKNEIRDKYAGVNLNSNYLYLKDVPFAQIKPDDTDQQKVLIEYDNWVNLQWEWTGLQQIFNPGVTQFQIFKRAGLLNDRQGTVTGEPLAGTTNRNFKISTTIYLPGQDSELNGKICLIDHRAYVILGHTAGQAATFDLHYDGYPILVPEKGAVFMLTLPETHSAWLDFRQPGQWENSDQPINVSPPHPFELMGQRVIAKVDAVGGLSKMLEEKGINWIPPETAWRLRLYDTPVPPAYVPLPTSQYVPGAIVVNCGGTMQAWYVLWHEWMADELDLYITVADENLQENYRGQQPAPTSPLDMVDTSSPIHFYVGQAFSEQIIIRPPGDGEPPTLPWHFAVASNAYRADLRRNVTGPLSLKASVVAVDRRLPVAPERPTIDSISLADVHGQSIASISWRPSTGVYGYNLYRATDTAIFERDLENRRLGLGFYEDHRLIFADDYDRDEFLRAIQHKDAALFVAGDFETTVGKRLTDLDFSDLYGRDKEKYGSVWNALTPIWQYWADRFYPALDDTKKEAIANRKGNETAFTLVNHEPCRKTEYTDTVNGVVSNQYFYRLRTVAPNMALSSTWGPVSIGQGVRVPAARPRTPVWTKVEAGDRQVTLQWALNREPDFKEYILYRATNKDLLNDVRWAEVEPQEGLMVRRIGDPRILTRIANRESIIVFPSEQTPPPMSSIVGIYRAFEFDNKVVGEQLGAMNLVQASTRIMDNVISGIRKVADKTEVVIVWRNVQGGVEVMMAFGEWPYIDRTVEGLKEYQYKMASENASNMCSEVSKVVFAKALNEYSPGSPEWNPPVLNEENTLHLSWSAPNTTFRCIVQRQVSTSNTWDNISGWLPRGAFAFDDVTRDNRFLYNYRLLVMDANGKINKEFNILTV